MVHKFKLRQTGMHGLDEFVQIVMIDTGNRAVRTMDQNKEWELEARLQVTFWANDAQVHEARKVALKALYAGIYQDVWRLLPSLRKAISDGSRERAYRLVNMIESTILEPEREVQ